MTTHTHRAFYTVKNQSHGYFKLSTRDFYRVKATIHGERGGGKHIQLQQEILPKGQEGWRSHYYEG